MNNIERILLSVAACFIFGCAFAQGTYTLHFNKEDFRFETVDSVLVISTLNHIPLYMEDTEAPALPYFANRLLRPQNTIVTDFQVSFEKELLYTDVDIESNPEIRPASSAENGADAVGKAVKSVTSPVVLVSNGSRYGYSYCYFKATPFIYDYPTKSLYFVSDITIVPVESSQVADEGYTGYMAEKAGVIRDMVINPDETADFYPSVSKSMKKAFSATASQEKNIYNGTTDYVIITTEALKPYFDELIQWKRKKGIRASIITVEDIDQSFSYMNRTLQEKIKTKLDLLQSLHGLKYVLLAGDPNIVPAQYCQIKANFKKDDKIEKKGNGGLTIDLTPCDLFYACNKGTNNLWDKNSNGIYGEFADKVNLDQNMYVTRIPVKTEEDVTHYVNKVIRYEKHPMFVSYLNKMLFMGAQLKMNSSGKSDTHNKSEKAYSEYISNYWPAGHDYLYDTGSNISGYSSISGSNAKALINSGYHFIHNESHGDILHYIYNEDGTDFYPVLDSDVPTNGEPSIFVTSSCQSNRFDADCLSRRLMNASKGALAYVGSSRDGSYYGSSFTKIGQSLQFDATFFKNLLTGKPADAPYRFGAVVAETKSQFQDEASSSETNGYRYLQFAINPLGDPETPIYTAIPSRFTGVTVTSKANNTVEVSTGGVSGCTIALVSYDNGETYFDVAENVSSYTFTEVNAPCYVTVTKHNYIPFSSSNCVFPKFEIEGSKALCGTNVYSIKHLPSSCTVTWQSDNADLDSLIQSDYPTYGQCSISNPDKKYIYTTLEATISKNGITYGNAVLWVSSAGDFTVTMKQKGGNVAGNSVIYPSISGTLGNESHYGAFELCETTLTSADFIDTDFTLSGDITPTLWQYNGNSVITLKFPSTGGVSKQFTVMGRQKSGCKVFKFHLTVMSGNNLKTNAQKSFSISSSGKVFTFSLNTPENLQLEQYDGIASVIEQEPGEWNLTITNVITGETVLQEKVSDSSTSIDTSEWRPGIYGVTGRIGGSTVSKKIMVK